MMNKHILLVIFITFVNSVFAQKTNDELKLISDSYSDNPEIRDILRFEGIDYHKLKFIGENLRKKTYRITVKEIWDGKITKESVFFDSKEIGIEKFQTVNDTVLDVKVIAKLTHKNKLKVTFMFPQFSVNGEYDAIETDEYSLRNMVAESGMDIKYDEKFYLLAYILPYERDGGGKSWCDVGSSGKEIDKWGDKFGIKHYLLFEMIFE